MSWAAAIGAGGAILGGAMGGGLLGGSKAPHTSKWYRENVKNLYGQASDVANQPFEYYNDPRFAEFTPDQQAGFDLVRGNVGLGSGAVNQAISGAQGAMGYNPLQVSPGNVAAGQVNVNYNPNTVTADQVSGAYNYNPLQVGGGFSYQPQTVSGGSVTAQQIKDKAFTDYDVNQYMNPFLSGVVDTSLADIENQRLRTENAQKADMMASGAWGGSRSGVAQALTNEGFGDTAARTAANLRMAGYESAADKIMQDANRNLTASQSNQAADLQAKITTAQLAAQAQIANQAAGLQSAMFGANFGQQAQLANQQAGMQNAQFGANLGFNAGLANQDAGLRAQMANLQSSQFGANLGLNAGLANQDAALRAAMANQSAGLNAQMANQGAGLQANQQQLAGSALLGNLGAQQQSMGAMDAQNMLNIGNMQQAQAQMPLDFAYQQYLMDQGWDQNNMNFLRGFLTDPRGVAQGGIAQPNQGLGILGGALTGANLANSIYGAWNNYRPQTYSYNNTLPPGVDSYDSYGNYGG